MSLKTSVQQAVNKAIIRRDTRCVTCGTRMNLSASHYYAVGSSPSVRFYSKNIHTQCLECHRAYERDETTYDDYLEEKFSTDTLFKLSWMAHRVCKLADFDLKEIKKLANGYDGSNDNLEKIDKIVIGGMC